MNESIENGCRRTIDGVTQVHYDGYWIKCYEPPLENLSEKKSLIQSLTRRLFNHMEHGINIPGRLLDDVRAAYAAETDPRKKRVKGAMLAGALFNRAADIFTHLCELEACGIEILPSNDLMRTCGRCLREALEFGKLVRHRNGDEGIDELWGEPFKAFIMPIDAFYESRYMKIAMTMENIDRVANHLAAYLQDDPRFRGLDQLILEFAKNARRKCEILRTDNDIFDVWTDFVVASEAVTGFTPLHHSNAPDEHLIDSTDVKQMLKDGVKLIAYITRARTPMPKSTEIFLSKCEQYKNRSC